MKLTDKSFWEEIYSHNQNNDALKISDFPDELFWKDILPKYVGNDLEGLKVIEIGSAPGNNLVKFNKFFNANVYGIEYTSNGYKMNIDNFKQNGIDENNVIHADFFSSNFQEMHKAQYDIVVSFGFIEHFNNIDEVIKMHLNLLKDGGTLIITIPNFKGFYYYWTRLFNKELLSKHNLEIMDKKVFRNIFNSRNLDVEFCDYVGVFHYGMLTYKKNIFARVLTSIVYRIQKYILNKVFTLFKNKSHYLESRIFSPYLVSIVKKKKHD